MSHFPFILCLLFPILLLKKWETMVPTKAPTKPPIMWFGFINSSKYGGESAPKLKEVPSHNPMLSVKNITNVLFVEHSKQNHNNLDHTRIYFLAYSLHATIRTQPLIYVQNNFPPLNQPQYFEENSRFLRLYSKEPDYVYSLYFCSVNQ